MADAEHTQMQGLVARANPAALAAFLRHGELGLLGLGLFSGVLAGLCAAAILAATRALHFLLFGVPFHAHLSSLAAFESPLQAAVPVLGGIVVGASTVLIHKWRPRRPADPIEANALRGGKMSLTDSVLITAQTVLSNGFGASVGIEAAYTQMGSGFASWLGGKLRLRRTDMRMLVACGSAGAIAAAFGAPLTGAFYAFELVLGTYTPFGLGPIGVAAIGGVLVSRALGMGGGFAGHVTEPAALTATDLVLLLGLALLCAAFGIAVMRGVTLVESVFRRSRLPQPLQPVLGGLVVGGLALVTPQVLGSGHGALFALLFGAGPPTVGVIALVLLLKSVASAVSIGSGFRGGLFFASLFLGTLLGKLYVTGLALAYPEVSFDPWVYAVAGMAALAVAIVGGPMTMSFLALETTGDFGLGLTMLAIATIVSVVLRRWFGYSFATWRLHLRGETIRSAQDVGWMRDLTVGRLMRPDTPKAPADMPVLRFMEEFPPGSRTWVVALDASGRYAGMIFGPDVHVLDVNGEAAEATIARLARCRDVMLLPEMNIKQAAALFEESGSETLAVVESEKDPRVIGTLTEAHVLRRYAAELDTALRALSDEVWTARG